MNKDHLDIVIEFCKKFSGVAEPTNVKMTDINEDGMEITCDQAKTFVPFLSKAGGDGFRESIIELYMSIKGDTNNSSVQGGMMKFINSFKTVVISSILDGQAVSSYSPFIKENDEFYICISSVADHYHSIKQNPDKISLLFIQDEKDAKSARDEFISKFESAFANESALAFIKEMKDFYIVKLTPTKGRYVKGFGAAYDTVGLQVVDSGRVNNPHTKK